MEFKITSIGDTCTVVGVSENSFVNLIIPAQIDGYMVVKLGDHLFENSCLMHLTIESPVITIGKSTFKNSLIETVKCKHIISVDDSAFESSYIKDITCTELDCIKSNAFKDCEKLSIIAFAKNASRISEDAFTNDNVALIGNSNSIVETFCQKTGHKFINLSNNSLPDVCPDCGIGWNFKREPQLHGSCPKCGKRIYVERSGKVIILDQKNVSS